MLSSGTKDDKTDSQPSVKTSDVEPVKPAAPSATRRRRLKFEETISPNAIRIRNITGMDIILGRGRGYQDRPGNRRLRTIVGRHKESYQASVQSQKRSLVEAVYDEITQDGARFLHKHDDEDAFVVVEVPVALQKVRNLLRCKKVFGKKTVQSKNKESSDSSRGNNHQGKRDTI